jgi:hypothetical protein
MADEKKGIKEGEPAGPPGVQSTTEALPASSPGSKDLTPAAPDTDPEAPPLHTGKPDVPIAQTLAAGSGEHTPPDPKEYDKQGRPRDVSGISQKDEEPGGAVKLAKDKG